MNYGGYQEKTLLDRSRTWSAVIIGFAAIPLIIVAFASPTANVINHPDLLLIAPSKDLTDPTHTHPGNIDGQILSIGAVGETLRL